MANRTGDFYPADTSVHGYGAELLVGSAASPNSFEAVAGVVRITPGEMSTEDIDITHLRSPDAHREHRPGLRDSGAFSAEVILMPGDESQNNAGGGDEAFESGGLVAMWRNRTTHDFIIRFAEGSPSHEWPFRGYVSSYQLGEIGPDDVVKATVGIQPTQAFDTDLP